MIQVDISLQTSVLHLHLQQIEMFLVFGVVPSSQNECSVQIFGCHRLVDLAKGVGRVRRGQDAVLARDNAALHQDHQEKWQQLHRLNILSSFSEISKHRKRGDDKEDRSHHEHEVGGHVYLLERLPHAFADDGYWSEESRTRAIHGLLYRVTEHQSLDNQNCNPLQRREREGLVQERAKELRVVELGVRTEVESATVRGRHPQASFLLGRLHTDVPGNALSLVQVSLRMRVCTRIFRFRDELGTRARANDRG